MPAADSKLGHVELHWENVGDGLAFLQSHGGTHDDRRLARMVLAAQLASHGFSEASWSFDSFQKTADWNDIMDKARQLVSDGSVQVLRNGYNNIVARVRSQTKPNTTYQSEIFRQDPQSRAITGSDCECGWGEFQNQPRTRQWKRYQDRPCKHILAAFWQAQSMPLDEDAHPDAQGPQDGSGGPQGAPGEQMPPTMGPEADQGFDPAQRSFDPSMAEGTSAGPGGPQGGQEGPPPPSPADVLPQFQPEMPQPPPLNPVSNPMFMVGPTPTNPVAMPPGGALSSVQNPWQMLDNGWHFGVAGDGTDGLVGDPTPPEPPPMKSGDLVQLRYPDTGILQGRSEAHGAGQQTDLQPGMVGEYMGTDPSTGMHSVLWMGKQWNKNKEMEPYGALGVHFDSYLIPRPDLRRPGPAVRRRR